MKSVKSIHKSSSMLIKFINHQIHDRGHKNHSCFNPSSPNDSTVPESSSLDSITDDNHIIPLSYKRIPILDLSRLGCRVHFEIDDNSTNENDRKNYDIRNRKKSE
ncbi:uncharacterized protein [Chironomus tepperi]|uniref:uncharacterized protein n=1 Tax=Chironomus tepperi TaxID=113505 RepID=UPI00391F322E